MLTPTGLESVWKGGYESRFRDRWREVCAKTVNMHYCCVTELVEFMVTQSKLFYEVMKALI